MSSSIRDVIYCVVPEVLADELLDKLESYYAGDPNVEAIVDRRKSSRRDGARRAAAIARSATAGARASPASSPSWPRIELPRQGIVEVVAHVDGGARGNPGPAAIGS